MSRSEPNAELQFARDMGKGTEKAVSFFCVGIDVSLGGDNGYGGDNMPDVKCSVSNCEYWGQNNRCQADVIMIEIDKHANTKFNAEFSGESFDSEHQDTASASSNTCCHTFKQRKPGQPVRGGSK